jgi:hypothetical protein
MTNLDLARRQFFTSSASGLGALALASLLNQDGLIGAESSSDRSADPLHPKAPHFAPKAKACIFFLPEGAPSHIDLFDPKPKLQEMHGQKLPDSMTEKVRFAFIKKETAVLLGSKRKFTPHGKSGMELSDFLPHLGTCADDICLVRSMHTGANGLDPAISLPYRYTIDIHDPRHRAIGAPCTQRLRPAVGPRRCKSLFSETVQQALKLAVVIFDPINWRQGDVKRFPHRLRCPKESRSSLQLALNPSQHRVPIQGERHTRPNSFCPE